MITRHALEIGCRGAGSKAGETSGAGERKMETLLFHRWVQDSNSSKGGICGLPPLLGLCPEGPGER